MRYLLLLSNQKTIGTIYAFQPIASTVALPLSGSSMLIVQTKTAFCFKYTHPCR